MPGTVLCVDNDRALVQILAKALESESYRVLCAYDGDQAVELAREERPDLVLLDLILPRRDGFSVLEAIREMDASGPVTPVVLISGCTPTREYRARAESLGAAAFATKPLPLERLLELVAANLKTSGDPPLRAAGEGLSGSLESLAFPALLHHLRGLRASGVLHLSRGKRRKWLELRDGRPTAVLSNLVSECLGNFLVRTGRITEDVLEESRRRMTDGALQGEILVAMDVLLENDIPGVLRAQAEEKLLEIFSWTTGEYRFERDARLQRRSELALDRSMANLVLDGVHGRLPLQRIDAWLRENADARVGRAESPFYRYQEIDLSPEHLKLLRSLEDPARVGDFRGAAEELRRALYGLCVTGMLELRGPAPAASESRPAPAPEAVAEPARPARTEEPELRAELTALADRLRGADPFEALGVAPSSSDAEIRDSCERLLGRIHPDRLRSPGLDRLARQIREQLEEAQQTLLDPARRAAYLVERKRRERERATQRVARAAVNAEREFLEGEAALRTRDWSRAIDCFGRAVELYPDAGEYHAHYGWALHLDKPDDSKVLKQAIAHVRKGIKLASESEKSYLYMGRLLQAGGRPEVAEKMFTRAVQIRPECTEALRELRLIHMRREKGKGFVRRLLRR